MLGFDFGGTKGAVGVAHPADDEPLAMRRFTAPAAATGPDLFAAAVDLADELLTEHDGEAVGVGVSFGGHIDVERGVIARSMHVQGWEAFPMVDRLHERFAAPAALENDANAGALGEWRYGAGRGHRDLLYVTVSTGVGGGWIVENTLVRGVNGMAGEIGHMLLDPHGPVCSCGRRGCVEALASGWAIARDAREAFGEDLTARDVAARATSGDETARDIMLTAARWLGTGVGNAICLMNPAAVVIGGGVSKTGPAYWRALCEAARERALPGVTVEIVPAAHPDHAPLLGALALAGQAAGLQKRDNPVRREQESTR